jgi:arylamine N-acetyltransferase
VTLLSARVPCADGSNGPEFDHLTLRVDLGEPWLADVGFGDCFIDPLRLRIELEQEQTAGPFRPLLRTLIHCGLRGDIISKRAGERNIFSG